MIQTPISFNAILDVKGINNKIDNIILTQFDTNAYSLNVSVISGTDILDLTNCTARVYFTKPDGTVSFQDMVIDDATNGKMSVELDSQIAAAQGRVKAELKIYNTSNMKLTIGIFFITVRNSSQDDAAIESTNEYSALVTALSTVTTIANKADKTYVDSQDTILSGKIGDFSGAGLAEVDLATAIRNDRASLADIATDVCYLGASTSNSDNTNAIQTALDRQGHVIISKPGTYITQTLKIGDNTTFELYPGVTLQLKANTANYLITNKDYINGNSNIALKGGIFDNNHTNGNNPTGAYIGCGLFFMNVTDLTLDNPKLMNSAKYAFLGVGITRFVAENVKLDTDSDGLHFQPPGKDIYINNLSGTTGDDMVAFTIGDYPNWQVSNIGNFENVVIDNIDSTNVLNVLKVTGSGAGSAYYFKNFRGKNWYGTSQIGVIRIVDDTDQLVNNKVYNFKFKNLQTQIQNIASGNVDYQFSNIVDGDIELDNIYLRNTESPIYVNGDAGTSGISGHASTINSLKLKNIKGTFNSGNSLFALRTGSSIKELIFEKVNFTMMKGNFCLIDGQSDKIIADGMEVSGDPGDLTKGFIFNLVNQAGAQTLFTNLFLNNIKVSNLQAFVSTDHNVNIFLNNVILDSTIQKRFKLTASNIPSNIVNIEATNCTGSLNPSYDAGTTLGYRINMNSGKVDFIRTDSRIRPQKNDKIMHTDGYYICTTAATGCSVAWVATHTQNVGDVIFSGNYVYKCTVAGTTGSTSPTFPTSGTVTDGTVTWAYYDVLAVYTKLA